MLFEDIPVSFSLQSLQSLVIALLIVFPKNALMCIKKVKLINHDCLPILMLLYIMLYIMHAYLMLFAALSYDVCLHNASYFYTDFVNFSFMLCLGLLTHSLFT